MIIKYVSSRVQIVLTAIFITFVVGVIAYSVYQYTYTPRLTQRQEQEHSNTKLFGAGGRDVRKAGQTVDMMGQSLSDRLDQVTLQCNKKKISNAERSRLLQETYDAGKTAMDNVSASKYQAAFEPHYPPLP